MEGVSELSCETTLPLMSAAVDREATRAEQVALDAHLGACAACRARWTRMQSLHAALPAILARPPRLDSAFAAQTSASLIARARRLGFSPGAFADWSLGRALAACAAFAAIVTGSGALVIGARLLQLAHGWENSWTAQGHDQLNTWLTRLPALPLERLPAIATIVLGIAGLRMLRLRATWRELRDTPRISGLRAGGLTLALALLFPVASLPLALHWTFQGDWNALVSLQALRMALFCSTAAALLCGLSLFLGKVARSLFGAIAAWGVFLVLGACLEIASPFGAWDPRQLDPLQAIPVLASAISLPDRWIGWSLAACAVAGACGGVLLYALPRLSARGARLAAALALALAAVFLGLAWREWGSARRLLQTVDVAVKEIPRTAVMLTARDGQGLARTIDYPMIPAPSGPAFAALLREDGDWRAPWAHTTRMREAFLRWDEDALVAAARDAMAHTPGVDIVATSFASGVQVDVDSAMHYTPDLYVQTQRPDLVEGRAAEEARAMLRGRFGSIPPPGMPLAVPLVPAFDGPRLRLRVGTTHRVTGRICLDGRPLPGRPVRLVSDRFLQMGPQERGRAVDGVVHHLALEVERARSHLRKQLDPSAIMPPEMPIMVGRTDADGRFTIDDVRDGRYHLLVLLEGRVGSLQLEPSSAGLSVKGTRVDRIGLIERANQADRVPPVEVRGHDVFLDTCSLRSTAHGR
jgi:hypothetical protein